jgi:hypothetical protein
MTALPESANRVEDLQALLPWIDQHARPPRQYSANLES